MIGPRSSDEKCFPRFPGCKKLSGSSLLLPGDDIHPNTCLKKRPAQMKIKNKKKIKAVPATETFREIFRRGFGWGDENNQKTWARTAAAKAPKREQN